MEIKSFRGFRQYEIDEESFLILEYYLIETKGMSGEKYYGIEINQQKVSHGIKDNIKCNSLLLSESKLEIEKLIDRFIGNGVTPDTMEYIVDDLV